MNAPVLPSISGIAVNSASLGSSAWLLRLRWFAVFGQCVTIAFTALVLKIELSYGPLMSLVMLTAVTNSLYGLWLRWHQEAATRRQVEEDRRLQISIAVRLQRVAFALMLLDIVTLTSMLYFSGGVANPFSLFYFVNLAVSSVMIRRLAAWLLTVFAITGYAGLLLMAPPVPEIGLTIMTQDSLGPVSTGFAFSTCAVVVTYFVSLTAEELKIRERQLVRIEKDREETRRLEGLTTLAAGAAHELATPLSTIDVIARELSHHLDGVDKPASVETDLMMIDGELERCRSILHRLRSAAGDSMDRQWNETSVGDLIDTALEGIRDPHRVDVIDSSEEVEQTPMWIPLEAVAQSLRNLIQNGLDASLEEQAVEVTSAVDSGRVVLKVRDHGHGMSDSTASRAMDPFFTTKDPDRGMGLGLFLTHNVIQQLGGTLEFDSEVNRGTQATVILPVGNHHSGS
ncbi:MAG: ATP-binding protein [Planctomycetota bacterium]